MLLWVKILLLLLASAFFYSYVGVIAWIPFLLFAGFLFVRDFFLLPGSENVSSVSVGTPLGVLGRYVVDEDDSYGLFIELCGRRVFVDLREDEHKARREMLALDLFANQELLSRSLTRYIGNSKTPPEDYVDSLGIHSNEEGRVEVFWQSGKYTLLKDMEFF